MWLIPIQKDRKKKKSEESNNRSNNVKGIEKVLKPRESMRLERESEEITMQDDERNRAREGDDSGRDDEEEE